jgi:hydroxyacylglutathione hydrolase
MERWSEGIYLLGRYNSFQAGCWLLTHRGSGAIVELPPYDFHERSPALEAAQACERLNVTVNHLLCTHHHGDHFSLDTMEEFQARFRQASIHLHEGFRSYSPGLGGVNYFGDVQQLSLADEPLYLVHAPKHSATDTMVIFRGAVITGDWELGTIHSIYKGVPKAERLHSIETMIQFTRRYNYRIHKAFSVHANERRENVDFVKLMEETRLDRQLW